MTTQRQRSCATLRSTLQRYIQVTIILLRVTFSRVKDFRSQQLVSAVTEVDTNVPVSIHLNHLGLKVFDIKLTDSTVALLFA